VVINESIDGFSLKDSKRKDFTHLAADSPDPDDHSVQLVLPEA
jgi:hypothetical protein